MVLTDFVCLYNYEFGLSLCKIVRSSVILLLPLLTILSNRSSWIFTERPCFYNEIETQLGIYLKLFVMLYADDTVLMAESSADLQNQLNSPLTYSIVTWKKFWLTIIIRNARFCTTIHIYNYIIHIIIHVI
jgi:hypothetical protein